MTLVAEVNAACADENSFLTFSGRSFSKDCSAVTYAANILGA
jgi:hypothetical protein